MPARDATAAPRPFFGSWVVRAAFVVALFGWGVGFYGPPVFLHAVVHRTGWPLPWVSLAVTLHFLAGAATVTQLPRLHRRFGIAACTLAGACVSTLGLLGWATAREPWQLLLAVLCSGAGWVPLGAAAVNAIVSPWYVQQRPTALSKAFNGASIGGVIFSPLWVALIAQLGFVGAAAAVGGVMVLCVAALARRVLAATPAQLGQHADGGAAPAGAAAAVASTAARFRNPWRDRRFVTLAGGMATGLFAQLGLITHLFALLVPQLGAQQAGLLMGAATASAIGARSLVAHALQTRGNSGRVRRNALCAGYAVQWLGTALLLTAGPGDVTPTVLGVLLFGSHIGNAVSLPPLVAQAEFDAADQPRVVALLVATSQGTYAFAPLLFGLLLAWNGGGTAAFFGVAMAVQLLAVACFLIGRR